MKVTKEKIEELKTAHKDIYAAVIKYKDENGDVKNVEFIHKKPFFEDYESFQNEIQKQGSSVATLNLIAGIIVYPEPAEIVTQLQACPMATDKWMLENISPFFGGDVLEATSTKL